MSDRTNETRKAPESFETLANHVKYVIESSFSSSCFGNFLDPTFEFAISKSARQM